METCGKRPKPKPDQNSPGNGTHEAISLPPCACPNKKSFRPMSRLTCNRVCRISSRITVRSATLLGLRGPAAAAVTSLAGPRTPSDAPVSRSLLTLPPRSCLRVERLHSVDAAASSSVGAASRGVRTSMPSSIAARPFLRARSTMVSPLLCSNPLAPTA